MKNSRRALIVRGGWDGHQPVETTSEFIPFLEPNGFELRIADGTADYADTDYLATVDLIVQVNTMSTIEPEEFAGLQAAARDSPAGTVVLLAPIAPTQTTCT